jgi:adenylate kinase family enzyme
MPEPRKILVYGVTGSGKTTMAERISRVTGLRWHSVDDLTWEPGWVAVPSEEQRRRIAAICAGDEWILDSGYSSWVDIPLSRADLIVALDYPRWLSLSRLIRRCLRRIVDRRPICNGNRETLGLLFRRDSILVWHFRSFARKHRRIQAWSTDPSGPRVLRFRWPRQAERWITNSATMPSSSPQDSADSLH